MKKSIKFLLAIVSAIVVLIVAAIIVLAQYNIHFACIDMGESEMLKTSLTIGGIYSSSNPSVVTVDGNGCVTGHRNGVALITVRSATADGLQETYIYRVDSDFDEQQADAIQNIINTIFVFFVTMVTMLGLYKAANIVNSFVKANYNVKSMSVA